MSRPTPKRPHRSLGQRKPKPLGQVAREAFIRMMNPQGNRWQVAAQAVARAVRRRDKAKPVPVPLGEDQCKYRDCQGHVIPKKKWCNNRAKSGWYCSRLRQHKGKHCACNNKEHGLAEWPQAKSRGRR